MFFHDRPSDFVSHFSPSRTIKLQFHRQPPLRGVASHGRRSAASAGTVVAEEMIKYAGDQRVRN
jgi:hypothetical protein